jgi:aspartate aminotransferase-like enzyme
MIRNAYRLRLPGPTAVPERVRQAIARPVLSHRGPEFVALLDRAEEMLQFVLGTRNPVLFFASSGTGMMEASLVNILAPGERVLVCVNGQFGERYAEIAQALGAAVDTIDIPWGHAIDPDEVEKRVETTDYRAVVVVHNESSTGVVADLEAIGGLLRNRSTLLVVDSVSGLGGIAMRQDHWGVDIVVSASQKALMCPPGIGIASVSRKAWEVVRRDDRLPRYFWDFRKAMVNGEKSETPFTPPVSLIAGLYEALKMISDEGVAQVVARHEKLSAALRAGCNALGFSTFGDEQALSSTVVVLNVPEKLDGNAVVRQLYLHGTVIAGSRNKLAGRVIRIGTMGSLNEGDILTDLAHLSQALEELGWPKKEPGAALAAAAAKIGIVSGR